MELIYFILIIGISLILHCNTLYSENTHSIWAPKIPSWKSTMVVSKIFSKKSTTRKSILLVILFKLINLMFAESTSRCTKQRRFGMNIVWLTIWLPMLWNQKVVLFGLAKTTTVTFSRTRLLKGMDLWEWWLLSSFALMERLLKLKLRMEQWLVTTECTSKERDIHKSYRLVIVLYLLFMGELLTY